MSQSGNKQNGPQKLVFKRTHDASVLLNFSCGISSMDNLIVKDKEPKEWEIAIYSLLWNCHI